MKPKKRLRPAATRSDSIGAVVRDVRDEASFIGARLPELAARLNMLPTPRTGAPLGAAAAPSLAAAGTPAGLRWRSGTIRWIVAVYIGLWEGSPWLRPLLAVGRKASAPAAHAFERIRHGNRDAARGPRGRWTSGPALAAIGLYERLWNAHPRNRRILLAARRAAAPVFRVVELIAPRRRA